MVCCKTVRVTLQAICPEHAPNPEQMLRRQLVEGCILSRRLAEFGSSETVSAVHAADPDAAAVRRCERAARLARRG